MNIEKEYSEMTLDELLSAEKKLKKQNVLTAALIGLFVGVAFWSAIDGKFMLPVAMLIFAFVVGSSFNKKKKSLQTEINSRNTAG